MICAEQYLVKSVWMFSNDGTPSCLTQTHTSQTSPSELNTRAAYSLCVSHRDTSLYNDTVMVMLSLDFNIFLPQAPQIDQLVFVLCLTDRLTATNCLIVGYDESQNQRDTQRDKRLISTFHTKNLWVVVILHSDPSMSINKAPVWSWAAHPCSFLYSVQWLLMCVSAISTEKCVSVSQWLIDELPQQLWGCQPHNDVSVAMETVEQGRGLDKDEERERGRWRWLWETDTWSRERKSWTRLPTHVLSVCVSVCVSVCGGACVCVRVYVRVQQQG